MWESPTGQAVVQSGSRDKCLARGEVDFKCKIKSLTQEKTICSFALCRPECAGVEVEVLDMDVIRKYGGIDFGSASQ